MAVEHDFGSEQRIAPDVADDERFVVDVDGFEGPLDLLLELARRQKVDLQKISVLRSPSSTSPSSRRRVRCASS